MQQLDPSPSATTLSSRDHPTFIDMQQGRRITLVVWAAGEGGCFCMWGNFPRCEQLTCARCLALTHDSHAPDKYLTQHLKRITDSQAHSAWRSPDLSGSGPSLLQHCSVLPPYHASARSAAGQVQSSMSGTLGPRGPQTP